MDMPVSLPPPSGYSKTVIRKEITDAVRWGGEEGEVRTPVERGSMEVINVGVAGRWAESSVATVIIEW